MYRSGGSIAPTVAGTAGATTYPSPEAAKAAFSRTNGPLTAVLEDVTWIRLEADPQTAEQRYASYFRGLTVIDVQIHTANFARPTEETYLLEDSAGVRVTSKPETFTSAIQGGLGPKFFAEFQLTFPHTLSKDVRWVRLTRQAPEGGTVTWDMP